MVKSVSSRATPVRIIIVVGILMLAFSTIVWWQFIFISPKNVFERMIANGLASSSVSKRVSQTDDEQKLNQNIALFTQPVAQVHSTSVLKQTADTAITTESIATPTADYVRYSDIATGQKNAESKPFDFSSVLGVWGRSDQSSPETGGAQLFNQTLLGVVPVANLPQPARKALFNQIMDSGAYKTDYSKVKKQRVNGRPVYTYDVSVQPSPYVSMLKTFAHSLGLKQLEQVDPAQYANSAPLSFIFEIDVWSGQLTKVTYTDSVRSEIYGSYGARVPVAIPTNSIPVNELQDRLQQIR